uniref:Uncharacterized protein n=1 Tax=Tanacetum cinerariifolium TaxID=118510 RepID=A0A6L2PAL4_TANCI|nr:hypothetical protein [Tanacetum cinerariifolium]
MPTDGRGGCGEGRLADQRGERDEQKSLNENSEDESGGKDKMKGRSALAVLNNMYITLGASYELILNNMHFCANSTKFRKVSEANNYYSWNLGSWKCEKLKHLVALI